MHTLTQLRAGELAGATRLDLAEGLTDFPQEIFTLADTLEVLNLSGNALRELPADLPRLHRLRVLFASDNKFERVPEVLGQCPNLEMVGFKANRIRELPGAALPPQLRWLILTDNALEALPPEIGNCPRLQKLMLAGNRLHTLPPELARCTNLELLRLAANELLELPTWLLTMPRLSWLAFAGNPLTAGAEAAAEVHPARPAIAWTELQLREVLGEGASGVIYRAEWQTASAASQPVALKLFKGAVTSDGLPHSEMLACLNAGLHPNLIAVEGRLTGHPADTEGLVLELIDPGFTNLAGRPPWPAAPATSTRPRPNSSCPRCCGWPRHCRGGGPPARPRHYARRPVRPQHSRNRRGHGLAGRLRGGRLHATSQPRGRRSFAPPRKPGLRQSAGRAARLLPAPA
nr:leucine-rich repeat-containing protein kinase family protein [Hymenobacter sp. CCM 8763]